jgi:hypothetical protein
MQARRLQHHGFYHASVVFDSPTAAAAGRSFRTDGNRAVWMLSGIRTEAEYGDWQSASCEPPVKFDGDRLSGRIAHRLAICIRDLAQLN